MQGEVLERITHQVVLEVAGLVVLLLQQQMEQQLQPTQAVAVVEQIVWMLEGWLVMAVQVS